MTRAPGPRPARGSPHPRQLHHPRPQALLVLEEGDGLADLGLGAREIADADRRDAHVAVRLGERVDTARAPADDLVVSGNAPAGHVPG